MYYIVSSGAYSDWQFALYARYRDGVYSSFYQCATVYEIDDYACECFGYPLAPDTYYTTC